MQPGRMLVNQIKNLPKRETQQLEDRMRRLRQEFEHFEQRTRNLPENQRRAAFILLFESISDSMVSHLTAVETILAENMVQKGGGSGEGIAADEFISSLRKMIKIASAI